MRHILLTLTFLMIISSLLATGELFYFAVPYQASFEQEIRIVSWDETNYVSLERYNNGSWINVSTWLLGDMQAGDWVGEDFGVTYATTFRKTCDPGKKVSVFEVNWMETGSPGTSDMATMVSSESGTTAGSDLSLEIINV